jgi:uncharacterized protein YjdB
VAGSVSTPYSYEYDLSGLEPGKTYYFRAYAVNAAGVAKGSVLSFRTSAPQINPPTVYTKASDARETSAVLYGSVEANGGSQVTECGFYWGTSSSPSTRVKVAGSVSTPYSYEYDLSGLEPGKTYYFRAYAVNAKGSGYGTVKSFTTPKIATVPQIEEEIKVRINGALQNYPQPPVMINGNVMVPLRGIFEALGAEVRWDGGSQTITAVKGSITIVLQVGNSYATKNGERVYISEPPRVINGSTMVPVRFVSEALGAQVKWDSATRTVEITVSEAAEKVVLVSDITINKSSLSLNKGATETLEAEISPSNATNKKINWSSSNELVAKVSDSGVVTAVGAGTAVITATAADGSGKYARCNVAVKEAPVVEQIIPVENTIKVKINGQLQNYPQPPVLINGRVMVPMRGIFEALGAEVRWDGTTGTITAIKGSITMILKIGDSVASVNGERVQMGQPAQIINGSTVVPVRFVSEALGAKVEWDAVARIVYISSNTEKTDNDQIVPIENIEIISSPELKSGSVLNGDNVITLKAISKIKLTSVYYYLVDKNDPARKDDGIGQSKNPDNQWSVIFDPNKKPNGTYELAVSGKDINGKVFYGRSIDPITISTPDIQIIAPDLQNGTILKGRGDITLKAASKIKLKKVYYYLVDKNASVKKDDEIGVSTDLENQWAVKFNTNEKPNGTYELSIAGIDLNDKRVYGKSIDPIVIENPLVQLVLSKQYSEGSQVRGDLTVGARVLDKNITLVEYYVDNVYARTGFAKNGYAEVINTCLYADGIHTIAVNGRYENSNKPIHGTSIKLVFRNPIIIKLNGTELNTPVEPFISESGRTMIPFRTIFEAMNVNVKYEAPNKVFANKDGINMELTIGSNKFKLNGEIKTIDTKVIVKNGSTFVPLRFVAEALGADVKWVKEKKCVEINYNLDVRGLNDPSTEFRDLAQKAGRYIQSLCNQGKAERIYEVTLDGREYSVVRVIRGSVVKGSTSPDGFAFSANAGYDGRKRFDFKLHGYYFLDGNGNLVTDIAVIRCLEIIQAANFEYRLIQDMRAIYGQDPLADNLDSIRRTKQLRDQHDWAKRLIDFTSTATGSVISTALTLGTSTPVVLGAVGKDLAMDVAIKELNLQKFVHWQCMLMYEEIEKHTVKLMEYHNKYGDGYISRLDDAQDYLKSLTLNQMFGPTMNFDGEFGGYYKDYTVWNWAGDTVNKVLFGMLGNAKHLKVPNWEQKLGTFFSRMEKGTSVFDAWKVFEVPQITKWSNEIERIYQAGIAKLNPDYRDSLTYQLVR